MRKKKITWQFKNFRIYKDDLYGKHTNASNFRQPLQLLLLRYTIENAQVT